MIISSGDNVRQNGVGLIVGLERKLVKSGQFWCHSITKIILGDFMPNKRLARISIFVRNKKSRTISALTLSSSISFMIHSIATSHCKCLVFANISHDINIVQKMVSSVFPCIKFLTIGEGFAEE